MMEPQPSAQVEDRTWRRDVPYDRLWQPLIAVLRSPQTSDISAGHGDASCLQSGTASLADFDHGEPLAIVFLHCRLDLELRASFLMLGPLLGVELHTGESQGLLRSLVCLSRHRIGGVCQFNG